MKYIVFLTTGLKSNRNYIGVHKTENPSEFDGYLGDGINIGKASSFMYPKSALQFSVKMYGARNFKRITLATCNTFKEACTKANKIIDNIINDVDYYNFEKINTRIVYQYDLLGKLKRKWNFIDICDFYNYPQERMERFIELKVPFADSFWSFDDKINIDEYNENFVNHITYIYNMEGKLIKLFSEYKELSDFLKCTVKQALDAIKTQRELNGYYVSNKLYDLFKPKPRRQNKSQIFHVYKDTGEYLGAYKGKSVMKVINQHSWKKLANTFNMYDGWYKDFYLSLVTVDKVPERPYKKKVEVYTKDGNLVETVYNLNILGSKYKVPKNKIVDIQQGNKYFGDYIFKYYSK